MNKRVLLVDRPVGIPDARHFAIDEVPVRPPGDGEFLLRNRYLSVSPAMRGWVNAVRNYSDPVGIGEVMRANTVGEVVESRHPDYDVGDVLVGNFGWQTHALSGGEAVQTRLADPEAPLSAYLGVLGISGVTAYFGLLDIGEPQAGDTVVVSTAAGSVGSVVGQIAKARGCRTVGITGSRDKVALCTDVFGYDVALDYTAPDFADALAEATPDRVNVYYDNTAGPISDAVYGRLAMGARCIVCGTVSIASWDPLPLGPRIERSLLVNRARIQGFVIHDYRDRWPEAHKALAAWVGDGTIVYREEILDGIETAPGAIKRLYDGGNLGKLSIRV